MVGLSVLGKRAGGADFLMEAGAEGNRLGATERGGGGRMGKPESTAEATARASLPCSCSPFTACHHF